MARLVKADGSEEIVSPAQKVFSLDELQALVGGYIELIAIGKFCMIVDEEGKLKGKPFNERATELAKTFLWDTDYIVGDALICQEHELEEDENGS